MKKVRADGGQRLMLSLSAYEPNAIQILLGGPSLNLEEGVELGVRVWYHMKANHN